MSGTRTRLIQCWVEPELHRRMRMVAAEKDTTLAGLVRSWVEERMAEASEKTEAAHVQ